jgi:anti-sigma factor RsiW
MDHDLVAPLLGAYALHALDDDELRVVAAHIDDCVRCRAEVSQYERVVSFFACADPR